MHLLRTVFFVSAHHGFTIRASHILGEQNTAADAISRNNPALFFSQVPTAQPTILHPSISRGSDDSATARLVIARLVTVVQELFVAGTAASTKKVYATGTNRDMKFCDATK